MNVTTLLVPLFATAALARRVIPDQMAYVDPVSYTHLRAHETVLDLVCRLLLEKKKSKIHKSTRT